MAEARPAESRFKTGVSWIMGVAVLGMAWLVPETASSAGLGWAAALLMAYALRSGRGYLAAYVAGVIGHIIGFHWVYRTVVVFGGFGRRRGPGLRVSSPASVHCNSWRSP